MYESRISHSAWLMPSSLWTRRVTQPELGTQRCSSARPFAKSSSRNERGKGISTSPLLCMCPTSALPKRNSLPPKRCGWTDICGHEETSSSILFKYSIIFSPLYYQYASESLIYTDVNPHKGEANYSFHP